ncbi:nucleosome assembly protein 1-like 1 [Uranotaenia lowii]|uniref:nucleosome assembly protein 1-like 1 n=1 Tax=Uranotaenia lowii TaxID=190385 RepID=UPI002478415C|nr:nucleosome assembly protein 1-like 1 [Uranotaenia lowii]
MEAEAKVQSSVPTEMPSLTEREESLIRQISSLDLKIKQIKKLATLPTNIRARLETLKKIQQEVLEQEAEFHSKVHLMEVDWQKRYDEMNEKRRQIVKGTCPTQAIDGASGNDDAGDQSQGIPEFWLTVFKMTPVTQTMIRNTDEEVLKRLVDVRVTVQNEPQPGFVLEFEFEPNDFFEDRILKKEYLMRCEPNPEKPFAFNGFEIYDTIGQEIHWKEGANLAKMVVTDGVGQKHEIMTTSFFNFFNPKALVEGDPLLSAQFLETDFEIGYYIKERVIPRAILFYLGEMDDELDDVSESLDDDSLCNLEEKEEVTTEKHPNSEEEIKVETVA